MFSLSKSSHRAVFILVTNVLPIVLMLFISITKWLPDVIASVLGWYFVFWFMKGGLLAMQIIASGIAVYGFWNHYHGREGKYHIWIGVQTVLVGAFQIVLLPTL